MIYAVLENIIILLLTIIGLVFGRYRILFLMAAALLMIWITFESFREEDDDKEIHPMYEAHIGKAALKETFADKELRTKRQMRPMALLHHKAIRHIIPCMGLMGAFSILSGNLTGFLVFFFMKTGVQRKYAGGTDGYPVQEQQGLSSYQSEEINVCSRALAGIALFVFTQLAVYKNTSIAMCILQTVFLTALYLFMAFAYRIIQRVEKARCEEKERIIASNISELHEKRLNEQLVMQKSIDEKNARLLERENISRSIHNSVGHSITAAIMTLDAADLLYDVRPDEARRKVKDANNRIRGSLESIRSAVRMLDEDNTLILAGELKSEIDMIIGDFVMDTNIQVHKDYSEIRDDIKIPHDHAAFLTGVLKEALTNGVKHGGAGEFMVILMGDSAHIRLEISDNGRSDFNESNSRIRIEKGFGIKKIISYAEKCGGKTSFANENGFKSMVELPLCLEDKEYEHV